MVSHSAFFHFRRHLGLIADYMTFLGGFRPFSRLGMMSSASPFQQITFETSMRFITDAAIAGQYDNLAAPSSRLVLGVPVRSGTGAFELYQDLDKANSNEEETQELQDE
jgi:DNA-directed RNA polymerase I subunit RPA1